MLFDCFFDFGCASTVKRDFVWKHLLLTLGFEPTTFRLLTGHNLTSSYRVCICDLSLAPIGCQYFGVPHRCLKNSNCHWQNHTEQEHLRCATLVLTESPLFDKFFVMLLTLVSFSATRWRASFFRPSGGEAWSLKFRRNPAILSSLRHT